MELLRRGRWARGCRGRCRHRRRPRQRVRGRSRWQPRGDGRGRGRGRRRRRRPRDPARAPHLRSEGAGAAATTTTTTATTAGPQEDRALGRHVLRLRQGDAQARGQGEDRGGGRGADEGTPEPPSAGRGAHRLDRVGRLQPAAFGAARRRGAGLHGFARHRHPAHHDEGLGQVEAYRQQQDEGGPGQKPARRDHRGIGSSHETPARPGRGAAPTRPRVVHARYDPRVRLACAIQSGAHPGPEGGRERGRGGGTYPLPFGTLVLAVDRATLAWSGHQLIDFYPVADLELKGFPTYYRWPGLGAPLAARVVPAALYNDLDNDPRIHDHYQFWFFSYETGNPILYSAMLLREALQHAVTRLDPQGHDPALRRMAVWGRHEEAAARRYPAARLSARDAVAPSGIPEGCRGSDPPVLYPAAENTPVTTGACAPQGGPEHDRS